ncbi:MAG: alpha/beta fold hydrolase [Ardenticatenaceae bacterium]
MAGFATAEIDTGETTIFLHSHGSGPPILLLHGFPQTHVMWRSVAPLLARDFIVVCIESIGWLSLTCCRPSQILVCTTCTQCQHKPIADRLGRQRSRSAAEQ